MSKRDLREIVIVAGGVAVILAIMGVVWARRAVRPCAR
jgi:FtsZ-interacting cell division protein ZipA